MADEEGKGVRNYKDKGTVPKGAYFFWQPEKVPLGMKRIMVQLE